MVVETSDVSYGLSRAETDQFTPLQLFLQPFHHVVNLSFNLDLKEKATTNEIKGELDQKQGGEGAAELLPEGSHATARLISRHYVPQR